MTDPDGQRYLRAHALTNIAWDAATRKLYADSVVNGLEFRNLNTLFGAAIRTEQAVIANDPANDPRRGSLPQNHPPLESFLGLPMFAGKTMIGMLGVANRPGGYDQGIVDFLEPRGYTVDCAADGVTGLHLAVTNAYDVIVLDVMLPGIDGITVCRKIREEARRQTPILMLTARDTLEDKITGLDAGADDYLVKPFEVRELAARLRSMVRRQRGATTRETYVIGDLAIDLATLKVTRAGRALSITPSANAPSRETKIQAS